MTGAIFRALIPPFTADFLALVLLACSVQCGSVPTVVEAGVATVETAICVMNTFSKDKGAGLSDGEATADTIKLCGTDAATIARVLDSHHAAEVRELGAKP